MSKTTVAVAAAGIAAALMTVPATAETDQRRDSVTPAVRDDIVVTATRATIATKTDTAIIDIPQSIGVVTAEQIVARGAIGLQEALRYSAGIRTEPNGNDYRFDYVTARGGFNAARYVDGMRTPDSSYIPRTEIFNLERIEVLRGPSSVLYGQGAAGGIVNSITKRPDFATRGEIGLQIGSFDRKQIQGDVTGALDSAGTIAGRALALYRDADNQVDYGKDDRVMFAPSLRFRPDDRTDVVVEGLYQRDHAASVNSFLPVLGTVLASPDSRLHRSVYTGEPSHNFYKSEQYTGSLFVTHRLADAVSYNGSLRYTSSNAQSDEIGPAVYSGVPNNFIDPDNRVIARYRYDLRGKARMLTTDNNLRVDLQTGPFRHKILAGVDYLRSRLLTRTLYTEDGVGPLDLYAPVYSSANVPPGTFVVQPNATDSQLGFYLQDQIDWQDVATLLTGVRRDRAVSVVGDDRQVDRATTFRAGLVMHPVPGLSPYVSYSESFLPTIGLNFFGERFVPQLGEQYEAGIKWQPDKNTLLAAAAFSILGTNRLETDPTNGLNQIQQGKVRSRGIELEATRTIARDYSVSLSYTYTHARTGRSIDSLDAKLPISGVPTHQASAFGEKAIALDERTALRIGAGVRYIGASVEGDVFYDPAPDGAIERLRTPGFTLFDALVALERDRWSLSVNATNLFNKYYYASCSPRQACGLGYARNVIGTFGYRF
jgi:iron complex outermembrane receptor protein